MESGETKQLQPGLASGQAQEELKTLLEADYTEFLRLQTTANMEQDRKLREQKEKTLQLQQQLENMKISRSGNPVTDPKSAMRLPTCPPPKFNGST